MKFKDSHRYILHLNVLIVSKTPVKIKNSVYLIKYVSQLDNLLMDLINYHLNILIIQFVYTISINTVVLLRKASFIIFKKNLLFFFDFFQFIDSINSKLKIMFFKYFFKI